MLKSILITTISFLSISSFACEIDEAQIIGLVTSSSVDVYNECLVTARLSHAGNNVFCPIGVAAGDMVDFIVPKSASGACPLVGREISGVLQLKNGEFRLDQ